MSRSEIERILSAYDQYAHVDKWSFSNPGHRRIVAERDELLIDALRTRTSRPISECQILEVGCGDGYFLGQLNRAGVPAPNLFGIDILRRRIELAKEQHPSIFFAEADAQQIEFPAARFDIVVAMTVFSSVLDDETARQMAREVDRVLRPGGLIGWYDLRYPNPFNRNVRPLRLPNLRRLFPGYRLELRTATLLPPVAYRLGVLTEKLYGVLSLLPAFRSHLIGTLRKA